MKKSAFSLVELSVVLIVIGLLVATVSVSSKLISNSKIRSVINEIEKVKSSINTFYGSFESYPGDFDRATSYFSGASNGDGDKLVEYNAENAYAWLHLQKAEVIDGNYSGSMGDSGNGSTGGINTLGSRYHSAACFSFTGSLSHGSALGINTGLNGFILGHRWVNNACEGELFLPRDAEFIDLKLDDGVANKGNVIAVGGQINPPTSGSSGSVNLSTACESSGAYSTTTTTVECILHFLF